MAKSKPEIWAEKMIAAGKAAAKNSEVFKNFSDRDWILFCTAVTPQGMAKKVKRIIQADKALKKSLKNFHLPAEPAEKTSAFSSPKFVGLIPGHKKT